MCYVYDLLGFNLWSIDPSFRLRLAEIIALCTCTTYIHVVRTLPILAQLIKYSLLSDIKVQIHLNDQYQWTYISKWLIDMILIHDNVIALVFSHFTWCIKENGYFDQRNDSYRICTRQRIVSPLFLYVGNLPCWIFLLCNVLLFAWKSPCHSRLGRAKMPFKMRHFVGTIITLRARLEQCRNEQ